MRLNYVMVGFEGFFLSLTIYKLAGSWIFTVGFLALYIAVYLKLAFKNVGVGLLFTILAAIVWGIVVADLASGYGIDKMNLLSAVFGITSGLCVAVIRIQSFLSVYKEETGRSINFLV